MGRIKPSDRLFRLRAHNPRCRLRPAWSNSGGSPAYCRQRSSYCPRARRFVGGHPSRPPSAPPPRPNRRTEAYRRLTACGQDVAVVQSFSPPGRLPHTADCHRQAESAVMPGSVSDRHAFSKKSGVPFTVRIVRSDDADAWGNGTCNPLDRDTLGDMGSEQESRSVVCWGAKYGSMKIISVAARSISFDRCQQWLQPVL